MPESLYQTLRRILKLNVIKVTTSTVHEFLAQMKTYFVNVDSKAKYTIEEPLRSELYSSDQMKDHSQYLAELHILSKEKPADRLLKRLSDNEDILLRVRNLLSEAIKENNVITPAGEWLLDNFYLIEEQIRVAKKHLPKKYSEGLPALENGAS